MAGIDCSTDSVMIFKFEVKRKGDGVLGYVMMGQIPEAGYVTKGYGKVVRVSERTLTLWVE